MPNIVTRPVMASVASTITISCFSVVFDKVELRVARIVIISLIVRFGRFSGFATLYSTTSDYFLILAKVLPVTMVFINCAGSDINRVLKCVQF